MYDIQPFYDEFLISFSYRKINELREEHAEYLANRKQEALDAQSLMSDIAERKKKQEENKTDGKLAHEMIYK